MGFKVPIKELRFQYARSSGPGGQNVNKVNSKVLISWNVARTKSLSEAAKNRFLSKYSSKIKENGELSISSQRFREQARNIADCLEKIQEMVELILKAPKVRKKTAPSKSSIEKRIKSKKEKSEIKKNRGKISY